MIEPLLSNLHTLWATHDDGRRLTHRSHSILPHHDTVFTIDLSRVLPSSSPFLLRDEYRELYDFIKGSITARIDVKLLGQQGCGKYLLFRTSALATWLVTLLRVIYQGNLPSCFTSSWNEHCKANLPRFNALLTRFTYCMLGASMYSADVTSAPMLSMHTPTSGCFSIAIIWLSNRTLTSSTGTREFL